MILFERNAPYNDEALRNKADIQELIQFERFCRDNYLWEGMLQCFSKDSRVNISWFDGTGEEFVESSKSNESLCTTSNLQHPNLDESTSSRSNHASYDSNTD